MNPLHLALLCVGVMMALTLPAQTAQISGTVRDTNGAPLAGVEVKRYPSWGARANAVTDTNGQFRLELLSVNTGSKPFLVVRDPNRNLAVAREIEDETQQYDLQLAPALVISGRVQDEKGNPITNAVLYIVGLWGNAPSAIDYEKAPRLDAHGRFEIPALPMGRRYGLNVSAKGYGSVQSKSENLETNRVALPPITLRATDKKVFGIVVDADSKPVKGARVFISGEGQPNTSVVTDENGRFSKDKMTAGPITLTASSPREIALGTAFAEAHVGDTNIVLTLLQQAAIVRSQTQRASLFGKAMPDLTVAGIPPGTVQTNKPMLICLFDPEQRPSRRVMRLLGEQNDSLKQKGVTVVGISATLTTADALNEWKQSNPAPFPIGYVTEKTDKTQWILGTEKFPWLILTDTLGNVKAEGFDVDDLEAKLK